ncbi:right-handed parallel beta-helix repeat-containing protein [uncultured Metabacillus sp.]|uniref:right-handed parallel beta-helix repeat-containing protein n=1 Tax=uncultured Metabacillus sp. TaxID=2860135 RepID=UPI002612A78D|nr:right-handed parallel beta-helix repeat-containing protein [uncultured Metabacillus sp.]
MATNTEFANLSKPSLDDTPQLTIPSIASNMDIIDNYLEIHSNDIDELNTKVDTLSDSKVSGAKGDGTTDDTVALQAWLDTPGKNKILKNGVYRITSGLLSTEEGRTIRTEGATILADGEEIVALTVTGDNNKVSVEIDGNNKAAVGVLVLDASLCEVTNCRIENLYPKTRSARGIDIYTSGGIFVSNNIVRNVNSITNTTIGDDKGSSKGIVVHAESKATQPNTVIDNYIDTIIGEEGDGIHFLFYNNVSYPFLDSMGTIRGNTIKNCNRRAIKVQANDCEVSENKHINTLPLSELPNATASIGVINSSNVVVKDNTLDAKYFTGIKVDGYDVERSSGIRVTGNTIKGGLTPGTETRNETVGIYYNYIVDSVISNNTITDGIKAITGGRGENNVIQGNTIYGGTSSTGHLGINITSTNTLTVIKDNTFLSGTREFMISNLAPKCIIENNHCRTGNGIQTSASSTGSYYKNNTCATGKTIISGTTTGQHLDGNMAV